MSAQYKSKAEVKAEQVSQPSQDKVSQDKKNVSNQGESASQEPSQDDLTSIQGIARHSFNTSYAVVDRVIRESSKAGVEKAISDYRSQFEVFEKSFDRDFLHTIREEKEIQSYEIGASVMQLLTQSGVSALPQSNDEIISAEEPINDTNETLSVPVVDRLIERMNELEMAEDNLTDEERTELHEVRIKLLKLGMIE